MTVLIDGKSLSIKQVHKVSRLNEKVKLNEQYIPNIISSREKIDDVLNGSETVYGVNTGFGDLANVTIDKNKTEELQKNLVHSHASGVGEPLDEDVVRGILLLRANTLSKGYSGVRFKVIKTLLKMLNEGVHPVIPCQGSVGASGDLAPLAHLSLVLIGEGEAYYDGEKMEGSLAMKEAGIEPISLKAKEGLALLNGTQMMTSIAALALHDAEILLKSAQIAGAMSLEALKGTSKAFDKRIHEVRPHPGQISCAKNLRKLTMGSEIMDSHKDCEKVQDPYTLRCMPQVYGAVKDSLDHIKRIVNIEMNSANDNPLVFSNGEVISGGNFHGQPIAFAMDLFSMAISEIGDISERTTDKLLDHDESGLPPFLTKEPGLNSGFMIAQYTAASLVSENKVLAHPASVDSIPTSVGQEDHVSMGSIAARQAIDILRNVEHVVAIELIASAQGLDYIDMDPGKGVKTAYNLIREHVEPLAEDRPLTPDIKRSLKLIKDGILVKRVEEEVGTLY